MVQQLAAAAHKGQALLVLAGAGTFAYKQHLGIGHALAEHHVGARLAQAAALAGETFLLQSLQIHKKHLNLYGTPPKPPILMY